MSGILYIIATPIGLKEDITLEAIKILKMVDIIAAENLNTNKKRIEKFTGPLSCQWIPYFDNNEITQSLKIISLLKQNKNIGLISSAGTPVICDPGYKLIEQAYKHKIKVVPITGSSALIGALSIGAIKPFPFTFLGFAPRSVSNKFLKDINYWLDGNSSVIFYESSHRILNTIKFLWMNKSTTCRIVLVKDIGLEYFERILITEDNFDNFNHLGQWIVLIDKIKEKNIMEINP